jgi:hypothetical protein
MEARTESRRRRPAGRNAGAVDTRAEATWLVLLPLKRLLASTPFSREAVEVSRWPLAQMGALPRPELAPVPPGSSALTPGERMARPVKLPVGSGTASICVLVEDVAVGGIDRVHQRRGGLVGRRSRRQGVE